MKIEITKGRTAVSDFFAAPLSVEGEAELQNLRFVDALLELMEEQNISRIELARRMGIQPSRVTAMLSGTGNFTTQTMIRAARAVGAKYHHCIAPASHSVRWQSWEAAQASSLRAMPTAKKAAEVTFNIPGFFNDDSVAAA
jgi:plasmid maintenance system antidote protein VapI